jgi:hypothetical protein
LYVELLEKVTGNVANAPVLESEKSTEMLGAEDDNNNEYVATLVTGPLPVACNITVKLPVSKL